MMSDKDSHGALTEALARIVSGFQIHAITRIDKMIFSEDSREEAEAFLRAGGNLQEAMSKFDHRFLGTEKEEFNVFLNEGIDRIWELVTGGSAVHFDNATAYTGVGNSTTSASASDTGLIGASFLCLGMDATYPLGAGSGQDVDFRSTYGSAQANFAWEEFTVADGSGCDDAGAAINLHRTVSAQGTKVSGQTWVLTITLSAS